MVYATEMKRCLLILLVALMPFQPVWGGLLGLSEQGRETGVVQHGDHEHARTSPDRHAPSSENSPDGKGTPDTFHCHGHYVSMPMALPVIPMPLSLKPVLLVAERTESSHAPEAPDRPQWVRLA